MTFRVFEIPPTTLKNCVLSKNEISCLILKSTDGDTWVNMLPYDRSMISIQTCQKIDVFQLIFDSFTSNLNIDFCQKSFLRITNHFDSVISHKITALNFLLKKL